VDVFTTRRRAPDSWETDAERGPASLIGGRADNNHRGIFSTSAPAFGDERIVESRLRATAAAGWTVAPVKDAAWAACAPGCRMNTRRLVAVVEKARGGGGTEVDAWHSDGRDRAHGLPPRRRPAAIASP